MIYMAYDKKSCVKYFVFGEPSRDPCKLQLSNNKKQHAHIFFFDTIHISCYYNKVL